MENINKNNKIFIKMPIIMSIVTYLFFLIIELKSFTFSLKYLVFFILDNISFYLICIAVFIYFLNINDKSKNELSRRLLIGAYVLSFLYTAYITLSGIINYGFYNIFIYYVCFEFGLAFSIIYFYNLFYKNKADKVMLVVSSILMIIMFLFVDKVTINDIINSLFLLSYVPYFYKLKGTKKVRDVKRGEVEMKDNNAVYEIDGNMGSTLFVYEDRCVISIKDGLKSFFLGGALNATRGDKIFYYSDITTVQFKNLKTTSGYLQFEYPGSHSGNNFTSENSFVFSATIGSKKYNELKEIMPPVYEYILKKVSESKANKNSTVVQQLSAADELAKFKTLLDSGVISQEEFETKKKQLLGL